MKWVEFLRACALTMLVTAVSLIAPQHARAAVTLTFAESGNSGAVNSIYLNGSTYNVYYWNFGLSGTNTFDQITATFNFVGTPGSSPAVFGLFSGLMSGTTAGASGAKTVAGTGSPVAYPYTPLASASYSSGTESLNFLGGGATLTLAAGYYHMLVYSNNTSSVQWQLKPVTTTFTCTNCTGAAGGNVTIQSVPLPGTAALAAAAGAVLAGVRRRARRPARA